MEQASVFALSAAVAWSYFNTRIGTTPKAPGLSGIDTVHAQLATFTNPNPSVHPQLASINDQALLDGEWRQAHEELVNINRQDNLNFTQNPFFTGEYRDVLPPQTYELPPPDVWTK